jgi:hypothetical protein
MHQPRHVVAEFALTIGRSFPLVVSIRMAVFPAGCHPVWAKGEIVMRTRLLVISMGIVVLLGALVYAQTSATARPKPSANGSVGEAAQRETAAAAAVAVATAHACFQMYNGNSVLWNIDATFNPNVYPYTVTGGTIKGTICGSPNVTITGGSIGTSLSINANLPSGCATPVKIIGTATVPVGYQGTYGFWGANNNFSHHTLFLGYNKTSCP